jgi:dipeptide/tripeptide permease
MLPRSVLLISSGELAERFAFYGLSALLPLLLVSWDLSEDGATVLMSMFRALAYLSPLVGSVLADGVMGKFKTVVIGLVVYTVGMAFATGASLMSVHWPFFVGLFVIAAATGCIKSVISSLVGDQIPADSKKAMDAAFTVFYASIQCGSVC